MPKYRIALLPGNDAGVCFLEAAVECLQSSGLNAEYVWIDRNMDTFKKNIEKMKSTSCALSMPLSFFEKTPLFHPVTKIKEIFGLFSHFYFSKNFYPSPMPLVAIAHQTLPKEIPLYPISSNLRNLLESQYPQMSYFAENRLEEIIASLTIHSMACYSNMIEMVCSFALKYGFRSLLLMQEEDDDSYFFQEALEILKKYPSLHAKIVQSAEVCKNAMHPSEHHTMLIAPASFARTISYFHDAMQTGFSTTVDAGKSYALFSPRESRGIAIALGLTLEILLQYLGETEIKDRWNHALEKILQEDPANLSFLDTSCSAKEFFKHIKLH